MPSLHTAYAVILGVWGVALARRTWLRALWTLYPTLVVFSIVATATTSCWTRWPEPAWPAWR